MAAPFPRIALIGMGLIGASISHAARRARADVIVTGFDRDATEAVREADLVILCVPVGAVDAVMREIGAALKSGAVVSDVGSVKGSVVRDGAPHVPAGVHFIPAHPIAGTENSGPEAGFASLFERRWCVLTPVAGTDPEAIAALRRFWEGLGSNVEVMTPEHHDLVLGITSHVPHLIAYTIVNTAAHLERVTDSEVITFSAGGFRDFTRIAGSDPTMWRDVFLNNKEAVLEMLGRFTEDLIHVQRAIRFGDGETLFKLFSDAREIRRGVVKAGQDSGAAQAFYKSRDSADGGRTDSGGAT
jgi:cyclohexadieny/prephenate dehydrogenase